MKILLTGGTGLIGSELGKDLVRKGHHLFVLTRNAKTSSVKCPYPHTAIQWDGEKDSLDSKHFQGIDGVIHLAGVSVAEKRWSDKFKIRLENSRILLTKNLLKNAPSNLKFFIGASAIGYYPENSKPMDESVAPADNFFGELCKNWEAMAYQMLSGQPATRVCHIRTGIVLSAQGGALEQMLPPLKSGLGGPLADGTQIMSWIDIQDIVGIYLYALENKDVVGPINGVAPNPISNKKFTKIIGQRISRPVLVPVPRFSLKIIVGEFTKYLLMSQNVSAQKIVSLGYKFKFDTAESSLEKNIPKLKIAEARFASELYVNESVDKVFLFFSNVDNLEKITPPAMRFKVISKTTDKIEKGTLITYKLWLDGVIPLKWQTLITTWNPPNSFSDMQEKGPYKKWHHTHLFEPLGAGTLVKDQVDYSLPLGIIGLIFAGWKVRRDINKIFKYRTQVLNSTFK